MKHEELSNTAQPTPSHLREGWGEGLDLALHIAVEAHQGQTDLDGNPAILHPITVGMMGKTDEEKCAGFLHDVVEDTDWTFEQLAHMGIPTGIIQALRLLTHQSGEDYNTYVQRIIDSGNPIALQVKYNDLQHNFARGKAHPRLQAKHGPALERVRQAIEQLSQVDLYTVQDPTCTAIFAGGCFWGVQHEFEKEAGVTRTLVGYTGGEELSPTYAQVRDHETSHVEAVIVEFDPAQISYTRLCQIFFEMHDPAQTDGVGPDIGPQYRSEIFHLTDTQLQEAQAVIADLRSRGHEVNTLVRPAEPFWVGEEYHQRYYEKTGGEPYCHIRRKKF